MSFKFLNVEFHVTAPFALLISFLLAEDRSGIMTASLLAMTVHEAGHLIAMKLLGIAPKSVRLQLGGILIVADNFCTFSENVIIALAGPAANLIFTLLLVPIIIYFGSITVIKFAAVQVIIGVLNLMPVKGLDGGTVSFALFQKICNKYAELLSGIVSVTFSIVLFVVGVAAIVKNANNPSLLLLSIYLIILNIIKR